MYIVKQSLISAALIPFLMCLSPQIQTIDKPTNVVHDPVIALVKPVAMAKPIKTTNVEPLQPLETQEVVQTTTPASTPAQTAENAPQSVPSASASPASSGCGDNSFAQYIYEHESGCSTTVTNSLGCIGIGQACPGSKLLAVCPNLDYSCENQFFTSYADKYGGWAGAYAFWLSHLWW